MSENVGASTSRNSKSLHGLYRYSFTLPTKLGENWKSFIENNKCTSVKGKGKVVPVLN
jgi:hypothetical protein